MNFANTSKWHYIFRHYFIPFAFNVEFDINKIFLYATIEKTISVSYIVYRQISWKVFESFYEYVIKIVMKRFIVAFIHQFSMEKTEKRWSLVFNYSVFFFNLNISNTRCVCSDVQNLSSDVFILVFVFIVAIDVGS